MKRILAIVAALGLSLTAFADEGMWLLPLLQKMNGKALKEAGCKLTPEEIYSINHSSLKDAIIHFGGGCTGEIISSEGLIVTNHHCGYSSIQALSTDEHNYLMDGYWAMTRDQELPARGLSITFLQSMTDVTAVLEKAEKKIRKNETDEQKIQELLEAERKALVDKAQKDNKNCRAQLTNFYNDNVTYLIVSKTYRDVRFVGASWALRRHPSASSAVRPTTGCGPATPATSPCSACTPVPTTSRPTTARRTVPTRPRAI